jgi:hypothetical protein
MDYAEYQEISENEAQKERNQYEKLSVSELVEPGTKKVFWRIWPDMVCPIKR